VQVVSEPKLSEVRTQFQVQVAVPWAMVWHQLLNQDL
jgi:hypothetical protein